MAISLTVDTATLVALFVSTLLYGVFVVLFVASLYVLTVKRQTPRPNWILIVASITMFVFSTSILAISFSRVLDGFIVYRDGVGPVAFFSEIYEMKEVVRMTLTCVHMLLADGILIYRCWIVWSKNWWVVLGPLILWAGGFAVVIAVMVAHYMQLTNDQSVFAGAIGRCFTAAVSYTLAQNIILTSLLLFKIWRINRAAREMRQNSLWPVMAAMLESGCLYVTTLLVFLGVYVAQSNATFIMADVVNPMIGITFSLLIVRVGLGLTKTGTASSRHPRFTTSRHGQGPSLAVSIDRHVVVDVGSEGKGWEHELERRRDEDDKDLPGVPYA